MFHHSFPSITMCSDPHNEANSNPHHGGCEAGHPNYQNNTLILIIESILSEVPKAWQLVALA